MQATGWLTCLRASPVADLVQFVEALINIAVPEFFVDVIDGRMAIHACAQLIRHSLPLRERLVVEHVCMAAFFTEIDGESVAVPHRFQPRIFFETRLGDNGTRVSFCWCARDTLAAAVTCSFLIGGTKIRIVLKGKVLSPNCRIVRVVGQLHHSEERIACFVLPLHDVGQERQAEDRGGE